MPIKKIKGHNPVVQKKTLRNKKSYLLFPVLIVLSVIGYTVYKGNEDFFKQDEKITYSVKKIETKSETEQGKNLLPTIGKAKLQLESVDNIDKLKVIIEGKGGDKEDIKYNYEWFKNNEPVGINTDSISGFKKGDKIDVKITPFEDKDYGQPKILSIEITKTTPKIIESKEISFDGNLLSYQVKAVDPDGGSLTYSLIDAPKGMSINNDTGMIYWQVKAEDYGKYNIKVKISNSNGAEILYPLNIDIGKVTE
jgi:hypothetical protein